MFAGVVLLAGCGGDTAEEPNVAAQGGEAELRPAPEVRAEQREPITLSEPFLIEDLTVTINAVSLSPDSGSDRFYGARTWDVEARIENQGDSEASGLSFSVGCSDTAEHGERWATTGLDPAMALPPQSFEEGTVTVSTPIDFATGEPIPCADPALVVTPTGFIETETSHSLPLP